MAIYKFNTEFGEMQLLNPSIKIHGEVGIFFNEDETISGFIAPARLDIPGPSFMSWVFESDTMPETWNPPDIELWSETRLSEHKI